MWSMTVLPLFHICLLNNSPTRILLWMTLIFHKCSINYSCLFRIYHVLFLSVTAAEYNSFTGLYEYSWVTSTPSSKILDREVLQLLVRASLSCTLGLKCLYFSAITEEEHEITIVFNKKEITLHYFSFFFQSPSWGWSHAVTFFSGYWNIRMIYSTLNVSSFVMYNSWVLLLSPQHFAFW